MSSILIRGGTVVTAEAEFKHDVLVVGETIAAVGPWLDAPAGARVIDASGAYVGVNSPVLRAVADGLEADVEIAGYMMDYLGDHVHRVAQAYQVLTKQTSVADEFALGMVRGICAKLKEMIPAGDGPGIVLATKRNVLREHYGREMVIRYRKAAHSAHSAAGAVAGARVDVGRRGMGSAVGGQNLLK